MRRLLSVLVGLLVCAVASGANPPPVLTVPVGYTLTFSWTPVVDYSNGAALPGLPYYKLFDVTTSNPNLLEWSTKGATSMVRQMTQAGVYCFAIADEIYDGSPNGNQSLRTAPLCVQVVPNPVAGCKPGA